MACVHAEKADGSSDGHAGNNRQQSADQAGKSILMLPGIPCTLYCKHGHEARAASQEGDDGFHLQRDYFRLRRLMKTRMGKATAITAKIIIMFIDLNIGTAHGFRGSWTETCASGECEWHRA